MRVLIVDDDDYAVRTARILLKKLDFVTAIECANSVSQARKILTEKEFEAILLDIEMPQENGFVLLEWIQKQHIPSRTIITTAYGSLAYAQKAIKMDSVDFLQKPMRLADLENALHAADASYAKEKLIDKLEQARDFSRSYFILQLSTEGFEMSPEEIVRIAEQNGIDIDLHQLYIPVLFQIIRKNDIGEKISDVVRRDFSAYTQEYGSAINIWAGHNMLLSLIPYNGDIYVPHALYNTGLQLVRKWADQYQWNTNIYIRSMTTIDQIRTAFKEIVDAVQTYVVANQVFLYENQQDTDPDIIPKESWLLLLKKQSVNEFLHSVEQTLQEIAEKKQLTRKLLFQLKTDINAALRSYYAEQNLDISELFFSDAYLKLDQDSTKNSRVFIDQLQLILHEAESERRKQTDEDDLVQIVCQYIRLHYTEKISCKELGERFFINPDYLTRKFKKTVGMTISNYITFCRIEEARKILEQKNISVSQAASAVGYDNYSHFVRMFRKQYGTSPQELETNTGEKVN